MGLPVSRNRTYVPGVTEVASLDLNMLQDLAIQANKDAWLRWETFDPHIFQPGFASGGGGTFFNGGKLVAIGARSISPTDGVSLVGVTNNSNFIVSLDGRSWDIVVPGSFTSSKKPKSIIYSEVADLWIALGASASVGEIITAPDPTGAWTAQNDPGTDHDRNAIAESGAIIVIARSGGGPLSSTDGTTWTERTNPTAQNLYGVAWGSGPARFCAVGDDVVLTSPDGITWTDRTANVPAGLAGSVWKDIAYSPGLGLFMAIASPGIMTSPDGITWTERDVDPSWAGLTLDCIVADSGKGFYATSGITITPQIAARTLDGGVTWHVQSVAFLLGVLGIAIGNDRLIAFGEAQDLEGPNTVFGIGLGQIVG